MKGRGVRFIFWSSIKAAIAGFALLSAVPSAAQYFDIYGEANRNLPAAQAAYDAMPANASAHLRAELVSDLIMGLIGKAKFKEAYELYLANADLDLHPDAVAGAVGHGLVAFVTDEALQADYLARLQGVVESESCAPCYARTFAAHHIARYIYVKQDDLPTSVEWHKRALDLSRIDLAANDPARVQFAYQYASYLRNLDLEAAVGAVRETEALAFEVLPRDDHIGWLYVFLNNALIALDKGRTAEAADLFGRIADIGAKEWGPDSPQLLPIYQNTAVLLSRLGRTDQAVEVALMAEANEGYSDDGELGYQRALVARLMYENARVDEAIDYYNRALVLLERQQDNLVDMARARLDLADALGVTGDHEQALALTDLALSTYREMFEPTNPQRRGRETQAALILARAGETRRAAETLAPVLDYNEGVLLDLYARDQDRLAIASDGNSLFATSVAVSLLAGDAERAWRSAQLATISDLALSASALAYPGDPDGFSAALEKVRQARDDEEAARTRFAGGEGSAADLAAARIVREAAEAELEAGYPDFADYLRPRPLTIAEASGLLADDEAYIVPMVYPDRVVTLALTREGLVWGQAITALHEARQLIDRLRNSLDAGLGGQQTFDAEAAHRLYRLIFTAEITDVVAGKERLVFPASGPLSAIPPSVLVTSLPQAGAAPEYLIKHHAISINAGLGQRAPNRARAPRRFAGIGAPSLSPAPGDRFGLRGAIVDAEDISALPSLPGAQEELAALGAAFPDDEPLILTGDAATEAAVRAAPLDQYRVLAFATHGLVSGQISGLSEPALVMTPQAGANGAENDGLLTASEIARLSLAADWIILSACNTAAGEGRGAATYSGLARAFQLAGARSLLLSHWPVRDDAATRLSVATVTATGQGISRAEALRRAQLAMIADPEIPGGASPSIWGPFILIE
jgi:CHAT domain-containing protein